MEQPGWVLLWCVNLLYKREFIGLVHAFFFKNSNTLIILKNANDCIHKCVPTLFICPHLSFPNFIPDIIICQCREPVFYKWIFIEPSISKSGGHILFLDSDYQNPLVSKFNPTIFEIRIESRLFSAVQLIFHLRYYYSQICREFDTKGVYIFCEAISNRFIDNVPEDDGE